MKDMKRRSFFGVLFGAPVIATQALKAKPEPERLHMPGPKTVTLIYTGCTSTYIPSSLKPVK